MKWLYLFIVCVVGLLGLQAAPASAQATRTWVSGVGDDANPCSRTAPCKTFAGSISKTAAQGEINCLDPGGFGALTITKAITIKCDGVIGGVLVAGTNGITISAGATDAVTLDGLDIDGLCTNLTACGGGGGIVGVDIVSGGSVRIKNSYIYGFEVGVRIQNPTTRVAAVVSNTVLDYNETGVESNDAGPNPATAILDHVSIFGFEFNGVGVSGAAAIAEVNNSTIVSVQGNGIANASGGSILSYGNNRISAPTPGTPTGTVPFE